MVQFQMIRYAELLHIKTPMKLVLVQSLNSPTTSFTMKVLLVLALVAAASALPRSFRLVSGGGRIVGGEDAVQGQLPYQLSLRRSGSHICGASLIREDVALTAAHCVEGETAARITLVAGELSRGQTSGAEQMLNVKEIKIHENYDRPTIFSNDIALLILADDTLAVQNDDVKVIPIPPQEAQTPVGSDIRVSGWGTTSSGGGSLPDVLKFVDIPVVSDADCQRAYGSTTIQAHMLCAGIGGKDSCQGDSGGPLVSVTAGSPTENHVVGIVSWGNGCALPNYPGVNTEVSYFNAWINTNMPVRP